MTTTNLNLFTYNLKRDGDIGFDDLRSFINGSGSSSNMVKIDNWAFQQPIILSAILSSFSGSETLVSGSLNSIDGILGNSASQISEFSNRFEVIGSFTGSGQADFSSISQDYENLIILGVASVDYPYYFANIAVDFNGDVSGSAYETVQYGSSGSVYGGGSINKSETLSGSNISQIILGKVTGNSIANSAGSIFAMIPNYSSNGGFYKTAMGMSALTSGSYEFVSDYSGSAAHPQWVSTDLSGGVWKNNVSINRIRIFGSSGSSKHNLLAGSSFTLYGFN